MQICHWKYFLPMMLPLITAFSENASVYLHFSQGWIVGCTFVHILHKFLKHLVMGKYHTTKIPVDIELEDKAKTSFPRKSGISMNRKGQGECRCSLNSSVHWPFWGIVYFLLYFFKKKTGMCQQIYYNQDNWNFNLGNCHKVSKALLLCECLEKPISSFNDLLRHGILNLVFASVYLATLTFF